MKYSIKRNNHDELMHDGVDDDSLQHYGILGMHWGIRRYQDYNGHKINGKAIKKAEDVAIKKFKKKTKGDASRFSTGKNYEDAYDKFYDSIYGDKQFQDLSKKAFEAEKKRILSEKKYYDDDGEYIDEDKYIEYVNSDEYGKLRDASEKATEAKRNYVKKKAEEYADTMMDARLKDMNIAENTELAKTFLSSRYTDYWKDTAWANASYDGNLEFNFDGFYEPNIGWEDRKWVAYNRK